jgi:hypothetical protein
VLLREEGIRNPVRSITVFCAFYDTIILVHTVIITDEWDRMWKEMGVA